MNSTAKAREIKQLKSQNRKDTADQHSNDLLETKYKKCIEIIRDQNSKITELQSQVELLANTLIKYQNLLDSFIEKNGQPSKNNIISDFLHLYLEGFDKCTDEIYKMLIDVFKSSPASYEVLRKYFTFILPIQKVEEFQNKKVPNFPETLTNMEKIHETIRFFKEENDINSKQKIYASLAVDALFFKPDIKITSKGIVSGFINEVSLKKKILNYLQKI